MTGHPGWLCYDGMEIVNQERVSTYVDNCDCKGGGGNWIVEACDSCGCEMASALEDPNGEYTNPKDDNAPWYSATEPDSEQFNGFYVLSVETLAPGRITRSQTARASGRGVFFGPPVQQAPQIVVSGLLMGCTPCGVAYGYRWLNTALQGSACSDGCSGADLDFLDCCPEWTFQGDHVADIAPHLRMFKNVQLTSGLEVTQRIGDPCCCHPNSADLLQVQFTLAAAEPCVYRPPVVVAEDVPFDLENPTGCVVWLPGSGDDPCPTETDACEAPPDCLADPSCAPAAAPPVAPAPTNPCICTPLSTVEACTSIDSSIIPDWAGGVPIITINSGSNNLRQVRMRFIANPFNLPASELDPCAACGEVTLSHIPAYSTFVMDGTTRSVTIQCPGTSPTDATPLLGSAGGSLPFRFPELDCGGISYMLCVTADATTTAADATVSASIAVREC